MPRSSVWLEGMAGNMFFKKCRLDAQPLIDPLLRDYTVVSVFESKWKQAIVLERIEWIRGISLLPDADGRALKFSITQLVYADNGRGNSPLASVLRSVAEGNSSTLIDRKR